MDYVMMHVELKPAILHDNDCELHCNGDICSTIYTIWSALVFSTEIYNVKHDVLCTEWIQNPLVSLYL